LRAWAWTEGRNVRVECAGRRGDVDLMRAHAIGLAVAPDIPPGPMIGQLPARDAEFNEPV
jgi:hypothetical protein